MEVLVGTTAICAILVCLLFVIVEFCACRHFIPGVETGKESMPRYATSVVLFMFLSVTILLGFVFIYYINCGKNDAFQSGFIFSVLSVCMGIVIRLIYKGITTIANGVYKRKVLDDLSEEEIKWTFILICFGLAILCWVFNMQLLSYTFLVVILGKVVWLDISGKKALEEWESLKRLTASYWYVIIFIVVYLWAYSRYKTTIQFVAAEIGIIIGCILGIILGQLIHKIQEK